MDRAAILAKAAVVGLPRETVTVPEFDCTFIMQGMSGTQKDAWERSLLVLKRGERRDINTENIRARLVVRCLVDEHGVRVFSDADAAAVGGWRVDILQRLFEVAQRLNGVSNEDVDELGSPSARVDGSASATS